MPGVRDERLRTLIADDEQAAREVLRRDLADVDSIEIVGEALNGEHAKRQIEALDPDLVLLDIQMPAGDGFDVVRSIRGRLPAIVFVTAFSEHAIKAFEVGAVDYLLKPFRLERLLRAVERARNSWRNPRGYAEKIANVLNADAGHGPRKMKIVAVHRRDYLLLAVDEVFAFEASREIVWIHTENRRYRAAQTLREISDKLAGWGFLRVHRGVLVNGDKISRISALSSRRWLLTLANGFQCTVSKRNAAIVRTLLG